MKLGAKALSVKLDNNKLLYNTIDFNGNVEEINSDDILNGAVDLSNVVLDSDRNIRMIKDPYVLLYCMIINKVSLDSELLPLKFNYKIKKEEPKIRDKSIITLYDKHTHEVVLTETSKGKRKTLQKLIDIKLDSEYYNENLLINVLIHSLVQDIIKSFEYEELDESVWYQLSYVNEWLKQLKLFNSNVRGTFPFNYNYIETLEDIADSIVYVLHNYEIVILDTTKVKYQTGLNIASLYKDEVRKVVNK